MKSFYKSVDSNSLAILLRVQPGFENHLLYNVLIYPVNKLHYQWLEKQTELIFICSFVCMMLLQYNIMVLFGFC